MKLLLLGALKMSRFLFLFWVKLGRRYEVGKAHGIKPRSCSLFVAHCKGYKVGKAIALKPCCNSLFLPCINLFMIAYYVYYNIEQTETFVWCALTFLHTGET